MYLKIIRKPLTYKIYDNTKGGIDIMIKEWGHMLPNTKQENGH